MANNDNANAQNDHIKNTFLGIDVKGNIMALITLAVPVIGVVGGLKLHNSWFRKPDMPDLTLKAVLAKLNKANLAKMMNYLQEEYNNKYWLRENKQVIDIIKITYQMQKSAEIKDSSPLIPFPVNK